MTLEREEAIREEAKRLLEKQRLIEDTRHELYQRLEYVRRRSATLQYELHSLQRERILQEKREKGDQGAQAEARRAEAIKESIRLAQSIPPEELRRMLEEEQARAIAECKSSPDEDIKF